MLQDFVCVFFPAICHLVVDVIDCRGQSFFILISVFLFMLQDET